MTRPAIRILGPDDAEAFFDLRRQALRDAPLSFASSPNDDVASAIATIRDQLSRGPEAVVFGAGDDPLLCMAGVLRDRHLKASHKIHLWGFYVRSEARRQGLGAGLIEAAVDHARSLPGATTLRLSVSETATEAKALYERAGFQVWGVEPDALRHGGQSAAEYHMALDLTG